MKPVDRVLAELRKWSKNAIPWLPYEALREIVGLSDVELRRALARLRDDGLVESENRVGHRFGVWRAKR